MGRIHIEIVPWDERNFGTIGLQKHWTGFTKLTCIIHFTLIVLIFEIFTSGNFASTRCRQTSWR